MAPLARVPFLLAFVVLCLRQTGTAIPVEKNQGSVDKVVSELFAASEIPTAVLNGTDIGENSTSVTVDPTQTLIPSTDVPVSEPGVVASGVPDAPQGIETPVPSDGIVAVLSQALDTVQAAQAEIMTILNGPVLPGNAPVADSLETPSAELVSTPSPAVKDLQEPPKTINVTIGDGATRFTPAIIKANPGDTIMFNWAGKNNHSVTETDVFGSCNKSLAAGAFDSGVQPPGTQWSLLLPSNARGLKFFYCKVAKHCEEGGMSGTILVPE